MFVKVVAEGNISWFITNEFTKIKMVYADYNNINHIH